MAAAKMTATPRFPASEVLMVCGLTFTAATTSADDAFIVEMARHASVIEDWALPDPDSEDTRSLLPTGDGPTILAKDHAGVPVGAAWLIEHDPALIVDGHGAASPELVIAVAPERRGQGIGSALLDELQGVTTWVLRFVRSRPSRSVRPTFKGAAVIPGDA